MNIKIEKTVVMLVLHFVSQDWICRELKDSDTTEDYSMQKSEDDCTFVSVLIQ